MICSQSRKYSLSRWSCVGCRCKHGNNRQATAEVICSQSRKYSLSRRLFTFFEYIIHPLDKYCQHFPLPLPLFSVGLCPLLSFHSLRLSTERLFYVKTGADGKSPPAPHWLLRNRELRLRFLMQYFIAL